MSKIAKKFVIGILFILTAVTLLTVYCNSNFIGRYFLFKEKKEINAVCDRIISSKHPISETACDIESSKDVVIVWVEGSEDNDLLNVRIRDAFLSNGIGLDKYWLWEQDQQEAMEAGRKMRIYQQKKLHYSLLVEYLSIDNQFIAVAKIVPAVQQTLYLVNKVIIVILFGAGFMSFLLISILVQKIIRPLKKIGETAEAISSLEFRTVEIHTNDELETLANHINHMSDNLQQAHMELEQKNKQMKELLSNVSHDLKTPLSMMKAYANGMKDGIDDGTFLDTIKSQTDRMEQMIERLLCLARVQQKEYHFEQINISSCLMELMQDYHLQEKTRQIVLEADIQDNLFIHSNMETVNLIFSNLLSNAMKYSADKRIKINLYQEDEYCVFRIQNRVSTNHSIDTKRLWEPFYVAEQSRNQELSGTGLGLAIVKEASERLGWLCECDLEKGIISFTVTLSLLCHK